MFEESQLTVRDVVVMITAHALRFQLSDEGRFELGNLLKLCAGPRFENLNLSTYQMSKYFSSQEENIQRYFCCEGCAQKVISTTKVGQKVLNQTITCEKCKQKNKITALSPYNFTSVNLIYQMKKLLCNEKIVNDIFKSMEKAKNPPAAANAIVYRNTQDGSIAKKIAGYDERNNTFYITLNFNTDGAPLTKSGKRHFWPLQIIINDLSPSLRFNYVLLTGILIVPKEPDSDLLNLFISQTFLERLKELNNESIILTKNQNKITLKFKLLSCVVDAIARRIVQNKIQFNGFDGCSWCYEKGVYLEAAKGVRYPLEENINIRTHESHLKDVQDAEESGTIVRGCKGPCCLMELGYFDMVWGFPYEFLHALLLGVLLYLWNL